MVPSKPILLMQEHLLSTLWGNRISTVCCVITFMVVHVHELLNYPGPGLKSYCVITAQVVHWKSSGTCQLLVLLFYLMFVYYKMLLSIPVVMLDILGKLYW